MNNHNPWTTARFYKRLKEFMRDNPDLTESEACSILGKRGAEARKKISDSFPKQKPSVVTDVHIQNLTINYYVMEGKGYMQSKLKKLKSDNQLEFKF